MFSSSAMGPSSLMAQLDAGAFAQAPRNGAGPGPGGAGSGQGQAAPRKAMESRGLRRGKAIRCQMASGESRAFFVLPLSLSLLDRFGVLLSLSFLCAAGGLLWQVPPLGSPLRRLPAEGWG